MLLLLLLLLLLVLLVLLLLLLVVLPQLLLAFQVPPVVWHQNSEVIGVGKNWEYTAQ